MLDTEIHNGLEKKEIRDFFSLSILNAYKKRHDSIRKMPSQNFDGYVWAIEKEKINIHNAQMELEKLEALKAVAELASIYNWKEFDVSEFVSKSEKDGLYRNFFGTQEEFEKFMKDNGFED